MITNTCVILYQITNILACRNLITIFIFDSKNQDLLIYLTTKYLLMEEVLSVKDLRKSYVKNGLSGVKETVRAVDGISFSIKRNETLVLAGESASGKTTTALLILRAIEPDAGSITFDGVEIDNKKDVLRKLRMECQMIIQVFFKGVF